jgi:hypothetical protein
MLDVLLDALADMGYIELHDGGIYPTGKQPPSRPETG